MLDALFNRSNGFSHDSLQLRLTRPKWHFCQRSARVCPCACLLLSSGAQQKVASDSIRNQLVTARPFFASRDPRCNHAVNHAIEGWADSIPICDVPTIEFSVYRGTDFLVLL